MPLGLLNDRYTLATDVTFRKRIEVYLVQYAQTVMAEAGNVANHQARVVLAQRALADSGTQAIRFALALANDGTIGALTPLTNATVTDAHIEAAVQAAWNTMAGVHNAPA